MVIDLHTRAWNAPDQFGPELSRLLRLRQADRWIRLDASSAALQRATACVDIALVHGFRAERLGAHVPNEFIAELVRQDPGRRLGIAGVDPMSDDPVGQVDRAVELGLVGVSLSPVCQGFHPTHSQAMQVYERCAERGLPVFVSRAVPLSPSAMLEFGRPSAWDEVARSFPALPLVIGELGYPWIDEALVLAGKHATVWLEFSGIVSRPWQLFNALHTALGLGVLDRILFGSGFPHEAPARAIENTYSINSFSHGTQLPAVPRSLLQGIVERDALGCLGLEVDPVSAARAAQTPTPSLADEESDRVGTARSGSAGDRPELPAPKSR